MKKVGTPYTQCVHRIRLRPINPNFEDEDNQVTLGDYKPDPSLGKYRSEHELFDEALNNVLHQGQLYDNEKSPAEPEVEHLISGAAVPAATGNAAPTAPFVPPPPAPESAPLIEVADQLFLSLLNQRPRLRYTPISLDSVCPYL